MQHGTIGRTRRYDARQGAMMDVASANDANMILLLNEWGARLGSQIDHLEQGIGALHVETLPNQQEKIDSLTPRERIIIRHLACGFTSHYIAQLENVAERTVRCQCNNLYAKLGIAGRTQLAVWGLLTGIVKPAEIVTAWREHVPDMLR